MSTSRHNRLQPGKVARQFVLPDSYIDALELIAEREGLLWHGKPNLSEVVRCAIDYYCPDDIALATFAAHD